ncbi:MAG: sigma-70 family RNA polymerase sigma factor [Tolypothrix brevis GSE-NOS-MK-07-07A]|jgi:RNA polymerase sigma-B factor|nr:sigma-70 family RNA polymerase sigma factor [Tolypothrix brevis GSE-NOS-MK-07-07A]
MVCTTYLDNEVIFLEYHQNKDIRLRNILVEQNTGLVHMTAHKMTNYCTLPFEELVQVGILGLIKAVERFDPTKNRKFSTLAIPFIQGGILQWLRDKGHLVKIPRKLQETYQKVNRHSKNEGIPYIQAAAALDIELELAQESAVACTQHLLELPQSLTDNAVDDDFEWEPLLSQLPPQHAAIIRSIYIEVIPIKEVAREYSLKLSEIKRIETESIQLLRSITQGRVKCPSCGKYETIKNGKRTGKQSYLCKSCGHQFVENPLPVGRRGYGEEIKHKALLHIKEGKSLHWCETYLGIDHSTIYLWAKSYDIKSIKISRKLMTPVQQQWQLIGRFNCLAEWLTKNCSQSPQLDTALLKLNEAMQRSQEAVATEVKK